MDELIARWGAIPGMESVSAGVPSSELVMLSGMSGIPLIQFKFHVKDSGGVVREIDFLIEESVAPGIPVPAHVDAWRLPYAADLAAKQDSLPIYLFDPAAGKTHHVHPDYGVRRNAKSLVGGEALAARLRAIPGVASVDLLDNPLDTSETLIVCSLPGAKLEELVTHVPDTVILDASSYDGLFAAIATEIASHV